MNKEKRKEKKKLSLRKPRHWTYCTKTSNQLLNILKVVKETVSKKLDKVKSLTSQQIQHINKEIENIKKEKNGYSGAEKYITEIKNRDIH